MFGKKSHHSISLFARVVRSLTAISVITALILGIVFVVDNVSNINQEKVITYAEPVLQKVGVSSDKVGQVAGMFTSENKQTTPVSDKKLEAKVALISDIETENSGFVKSLEMSKAAGVDTVFILGDLTSWGDEASLIQVKNILDESGLTYYTIPGDHDLGDSVSKGDSTGLRNYMTVFQKNYHSILVGDKRFLILDNSANYTVVSSALTDAFYSDLPSADFVLMSQPLYHYLGIRSMGVIDGQSVAEVKTQADELLGAIRNSKVKAIFSGDLHYFSETVDPVRPDLIHYIVGAITPEQNLRSPAFVLLSLYDDGSYDASEIALN